MTLETFFEKFHLFADAPDAVAKMRELVLELAVQGKLVEQRASEPSADDLLNEIEAARDSYRKGGRGRKLEALAAVDSDETPFDIPPEWQWCRFGTLGLISSSCRVHEKDWTTSGVPFFRAREIVKLSKTGEVHNELFITEEHYQRLASEGLIPEPNDIMITGVGTIGVPYIVGDSDRFYFKDASVLIFKNCFGIYPHYLRLVMQSPYWDREIHKGSMGTTVHTFTIVRAKQTPIPLPPLAEQKRIVAKVDELMALCDRLEAQQQEREEQASQLARASLARFAEAPTPANLEYLFHSSFIIPPSSLRQSILTLAVQGKLVPQDSNDEPAEELLMRIAQKRSELLKASYPNREEASTQMRKQEAQMLPDGLESLAPGWSWATLIQASLLVVDCHNKTAPYVQSGTRLLRTTNIRDGRLNLTEPKFVDDATYERWSARCKPEPGDVLITREAPMGEVCIIPEGMKVCLGQRMMLIRLVPGTMDQKYLLYSLMAPDLMERVQDKPVGATVQHLRVGGVETLLTPIPPLAEQRRIVAKVEQLMALVDALETQLAASRATAANLLSALVAELTSINPRAAQHSREHTTTNLGHFQDRLLQGTGTNPKSKVRRGLVARS